VTKKKNPAILLQFLCFVEAYSKCMWAHMHTNVLLMPYILSIVPFQHAPVLFLFTNTILENIKKDLTALSHKLIG